MASYALVQVSLEEIKEAMRINPELVGVPMYFAIDEEGRVLLFPKLRPNSELGTLTIRVEG